MAESNQYYVTAEIKPNKEIEVIRIEADSALELAHSRTCDHVMFLRRVNQRRPPHGRLETKPLPLAVVAWPLAVLKTIASTRYGVMGQAEDDMSRGLRPLPSDADGRSSPSA